MPVSGNEPVLPAGYKTQIKRLLQKLVSDDSALREDAAHRLGRLGRLGVKATSAITPLMTALKDTDGSVATNAAYALGEIGVHDTERAPAIVSALLEHVDDRRTANWGSAHGGPATVRGGAWSSLHQLGNASTDAVAKYLHDEDPEKRDYALQVISAGGAASGKYVPTIIKMTTDCAPGVRIAAIQALETLQPDVPELIPALLECLKSRDESKDYKSLTFQQVFTDRDRQVPLAAIRALRILKRDAPMVIPALIECFSSKDDGIVAEALVAVSHFGPDASESVLPLITLLNSDNATRRAYAAYCLGKIGKPASPALERLRELLNDDDDVYNFEIKGALKTSDRHVYQWAQYAIEQISLGSEESRMP